MKSLSDKFQVRLYKFGKEPERIQKTDQLDGPRRPRASATRWSACWRNLRRCRWARS